jgi:predicted Zn finger-like uncharacterized protein
MIIRCAHCQGTMRVDEKDLPDRPKVKVRCPHCRGIGYIEHKFPRPTQAASSPAEGPTTKSNRAKFQLPQQVTDKTEIEYDISIPADAFKEFRFPAEQDSNGRSRNGIGNGATIGLKTVILVVASLITVVFFALLVNMILPGPAGVKGAIRAVQPEEEQMSAESTRDISPGIDSRPAPLRQKNRPNR